MKNDLTVIKGLKGNYIALHYGNSLPQNDINILFGWSDKHRKIQIIIDNNFKIYFKVIKSYNEFVNLTKSQAKDLIISVDNIHRFNQEDDYVVNNSVKILAHHLLNICHFIKKNG